MMTDQTTTFRAPCIILGCRRAFRRDSDDDGTCSYICGAHYRLADKGLRLQRTRLKRRARRHGWSPRLIRIDNWLWAKIFRQITERAMGI